MPFCPKCRTEYQQGTTSCADDGASLVDTLPPAEEPVTGERVDIYECYHDPQVDRVMSILANAGIEALVRDRSSSAFPTPAVANRKIIAVLPDAVAESVRLIEQATTDEVLIADEGALLAD